MCEDSILNAIVVTPSIFLVVEMLINFSKFSRKAKSSFFAFLFNKSLLEMREVNNRDRFKIELGINQVSRSTNDVVDELLVSTRSTTVNGVWIWEVSSHFATKHSVYLFDTLQDGLITCS